MTAEKQIHQDWAKGDGSSSQFWHWNLDNETRQCPRGLYCTCAQIKWGVVLLVVFILFVTRYTLLFFTSLAITTNCICRNITFTLCSALSLSIIIHSSIMPLVIDMQKITESVWLLFQDSSGKVLDEYSIRKWTFFMCCFLQESLVKN